MALKHGLPLALLAVLAGCDEVECGSGTYRDGAECVADAPVACGAGTVLVDGRCELDESALPDGGGPTPCAEGETRDEDGDCVPVAVVDYLACPDRPAAPGPGCAALEAGEYCVTGTIVDVVDGCPLGPDDGVAIALIDPIAAIGNPDAPPLAVAAPGDGGAFAVTTAQSALFLALVVDEPEGGGDAWTRSVTGVLARAPVAGETYDAVALATRGETRAAWADVLDRDDLTAGGFLVGRVLAGEPGALEPAGDVRVVVAGRDDLADCAEAAPCLRMFDDDPALTGFRDVGADTTAASGAFLLVHTGPGTLQVRISVTGGAADYATVSAGASPGRGFHASFVPLEAP
ncbi:MAG: hypothetical protein H6705_00665 [Myxococcales bacterium]|nr:hypothetical protein [Myxococcales bacterium]